jgi:hypothetical protein
MLAVAFDTLKLARKLESAGFPPKQAQDASAALAESFTEWQSAINLATRDDVRKVADDLRETELRLETKMAEIKADMIKWVVGTGFAQAAFILAVLKLN